jgi:hypothetical protein
MGATGNFLGSIATGIFNPIANVTRGVTTGTLNATLKQYGEYGSISTKKGGMTEFRLKKIPCRICGEQPSNNENKQTKKSTKVLNKTRKNK